MSNINYASELRIGNVVSFPIEKSGENSYYENSAIVKLSPLYASAFILNGDPKKYYEAPIRKIMPIQLTQEWLLKFGFNKDYKHGYIGKDFSNQDFVLTEPFVMGEFQKGYAFQFTASGWSKYKEFNFVHELQNFYFAMTGEELQLSGD